MLLKTAANSVPPISAVASTSTNSSNTTNTTATSAQTFGEYDYGMATYGKNPYA